MSRQAIGELGKSLEQAGLDDKLRPPSGLRWNFVWRCLGSTKQ